jgi:formate C-acetyltransferase
MKGPTAVMKSFCKLPCKDMNVGILNMRFTPPALEIGDNFIKFEALIEACNKMGGYHVQFNVVDYETRRDAQENPANHHNLMVRIAGYSA